MCTHPGISTRAWESRYRGERTASDGVYTEAANRTSPFTFSIGLVVHKWPVPGF